MRMPQPVVSSAVENRSLQLSARAELPHLVGQSGGFFDRIRDRRLVGEALSPPIEVGFGRREQVDVGKEVDTGQGENL